MADAFLHNRILAPAPCDCGCASIAALIVIMVLVGGATRLTEFGLSIVEWKPVAGTLPPLTQEQWAQAFDGYKTIPQYRELNAGMNSGGVQDHLLVGVEPPLSRSVHRHSLPAAVRLVHMARGAGYGSEAPALVHLRSRRVAGCGRLVDGCVGPVATRRGFASSSCDPSRAGAGDFRSHRLDVAAVGRSADVCRIGAAAGSPVLCCWF